MQRTGRTRPPPRQLAGAIRRPSSRGARGWRPTRPSAIYKARAATAEWVNADARTHRTLGQLLVRGLTKVHTWALWIALAHNMLRTMEIVPHLMT